jgi:hypothetical protein
VVRELRQSKAERIGGEGEAAAHRRWQNRSGTLAGSADPDDELRWFEMIFARENKEGRGRNQRGFYRGPRCGEGVRVWRDSIGRLGGCRAPARLCQRKKESLTCGPRMSARGERGSDTLSGFACWVMGWIWEWAEWLPLGLLFIFWFSFPFSIFLNSVLISIFFKFASNQIQTTFQIILIFNTMF